MARRAATAKPAAKGVANAVNQPAADPLSRYGAKRQFHLTPEPPADRVARSEPTAGLSYVIQKHWASRLHYDFRLELDGVLLSWAVPRGPSFDPKEKRMAAHVEDHPVTYGSFEGTIPPKQYGAGKVIVWDRGTWSPVGDPRAGMAAGKLVFDLHGEKLAGRWELVRIAKPGDKQDPWMLFKKRDAWARPTTEYDVIAALPDSVIAKPLGLVEEREPRGLESTPVGAAAGAAVASDLSLARKAKLPAALAPQLATAASSLPPGRWALEPKWDGYRLLTRIENGQARLFTRNGHDWTRKMPTLAAAIEQLGIGEAWLDGEIVVLDAHGAPEFNALQNAIDAGRNDEIVYFVFDVPYLGGMDLRAVPWAARRAALRGLIGPGAPERIRFSQDFDVPAAQMLEAARAMRLEGIVAKRVDAPYVSARTDSWLKLKGSRRQEFVVIGFNDRANAPGEVGSLLLGYFEGGVLHYAGNVGTGWDHRTGSDLHARLQKIEIDKPPVDAADVKPGRWGRRTAGGERWVRPELVVEVQFGEWTPEGRVRHSIYKGLRTDKAAAEVAREPDAVAAPTSKKPATDIQVTNPERVIDPSTGLRKIDVVRYYESVADWLLPHLKNRPVSLVRAPDGITGELFFQKHPESKMPGVRALAPSLWPGHGALLAVDNVKALVAAAQMNVIEFHTWNSTTQAIDKPDRIVFDLDPGDGVSWKEVQEAAQLMHAMLDALGLQCWLKTSGGKGLHVVVPLSPRLGYTEVKAFSKAVVEHMARTIPQKFVAVPGPKNRIGKVFVDYLRNGHAATTAAAFSARSRPGLGVSMPISWDQLHSLKSSAQWTIANAREHLSFAKDDPWADYWGCKQTLTAARKMLPRDGGAITR
ncbi:DNA ligase D [Ideonella sp.]|uniref:DNA ligase D n=1 Tax=Ideonella sp. TaxID=1929293 RepID=UPI0035B1538B